MRKEVVVKEVKGEHFQILEDQNLLVYSTSTGEACGMAFVQVEDGQLAF